MILNNKGVIIDIETLDNTATSSIIEIGAIYFEDFKVVSEFSKIINLQSCLDCGMTIGENTLKWWSTQQHFTKMLEGKTNIKTALKDFVKWYEPYSKLEFWANSPSFDIVILNNAFRLNGIKSPFLFYNERDLRTIKSLINIKVNTPHLALEDCKEELNILIEFNKQIKQ